MQVSTSSAPTGQGSDTLYMLYWGDYERETLGPYRGAAGLDFVALAARYRVARYAEAEAKQEDYCMLGESDFAQWLVQTGILGQVETTGVEVDLSSEISDAYVPKHWPLCPTCQTGRGESAYGKNRPSLNRVTHFHRCTECHHEWGHAEIASNTRLPMLDDDGRDTPGACVPYAISKACGLAFAPVLQVCARHGWSHTGMAQTHAIAAARELGFELAWTSTPGGGRSAPTLKQLLKSCAPGRNYIVGVKGHWLAIVGGQVVDNDTQSGLGRKVLELYEVRRVQ